MKVWRLAQRELKHYTMVRDTISTRLFGLPRSARSYSSGHKKVPVPFPFNGAKTVQTVVTLRFL